MNVVNLCFFAEGSYSEQTYEENIVISEDLYEKIKDQISEMKVSVSDLDGKHSEVLGEIEVQPCPENEIADWYTPSNNDGKSLYYELGILCKSLGLDLIEDIRNVEDFVESIDYKVDVTVSVKKSKKDELSQFVKTLE